MKMYFKNWIFALAGALAMTACSNEMEEQLAEGSGNSGQEVKFTVGIENLSRTTIADGTLVTSFEPNDEIGIFAYDGEKLVSSNVKYTYNGSEWTSENAIAAQDGVKLSYYAYYPYDASVTDPASIKDTVSADQTAGFGKNDMLSARNTEAGAEAARSPSWYIGPPRGTGRTSGPRARSAAVHNGIPTEFRSSSGDRSMPSAPDARQ